MTIIFFLIALFTLITSRYEKDNSKYLSKDQTNIIKGLFLLFVFIRHFIGYDLNLSNTWIDTIGLKIDAKLGQLIVTMFLFYSGYGIIESYKKNKTDYLKHFPKKRILSTLINFDVAVIIYVILYHSLYEKNFSINKFFFSLVGLDSYGNSNWYIFCILILYLISYLSLKSFNSKKGQLTSIATGTTLFMIIMSFYKPAYWYSTAFSFVFGVAFSLYKENIELWLNNKKMLCFLYAIVIFIISYKLKANIIFYVTFTLSFITLVLLVTKKFYINNFILKWLGKNLFPLYIFQRLPMFYLKHMGYFTASPYLFFIISLIATVIITLIYNLVQLMIKNLQQNILLKKSDNAI